MKAFVGRWLYRIGGPLVFLFVIRGSRRSRVLVLAEGRVLLQKSVISSQRWNLLGGGVHRHETYEQAAIREIMEESGLKLQLSQLSAFGQRTESSLGHHYQAVYFAAELKGLYDVAPAFEILELGWFSIDQLPNDMHPSAVWALESWRGRRDNTPKT